MDTFTYTAEPKPIIEHSEKAVSFRELVESKSAAPGWMLKQDPELARKLKINTDAAKALRKPSKPSIKETELEEGDVHYGKATMPYKPEFGNGKAKWRQTSFAKRNAHDEVGSGEMGAHGGGSNLIEPASHGKTDKLAVRSNIHTANKDTAATKKFALKQTRNIQGPKKPMLPEESLDEAHDTSDYSFLKKHGFKRAGVMSDGSIVHTHPLHGSVLLNKHGEWEHIPHGYDSPDDGFGGTTGNSLKAHLGRLNESEELTEAAHKLGDKVVITGGDKHSIGKTGYIGEIRHGLAKTSPKYYTIDHDQGSVQLRKEHFKKAQKGIFGESEHMSFKSLVEATARRVEPKGEKEYHVQGLGVHHDISLRPNIRVKASSEKEAKAKAKDVFNSRGHYPGSHYNSLHAAVVEGEDGSLLESLDRDASDWHRVAGHALIAAQREPRGSEEYHKHMTVHHKAGSIAFHKAGDSKMAYHHQAESDHHTELSGYDEDFHNGDSEHWSNF